MAQLQHASLLKYINQNQSQQKAEKMGLVSNTTPKLSNIRPDPTKTKRKSCGGLDRSIICNKKRQRNRNIMTLLI